MIQAQQTRMDTKKWDSLQWKIYMLNMLAILWYRSRGSSWRHFLERNKHEFYCYRFSFFTHNLYSHFMECIFFSTSTATHSIATRNFLSSSIFYVFIFLKKNHSFFAKENKPNKGNLRLRRVVLHRNGMSSYAHLLI